MEVNMDQVASSLSINGTSISSSTPLSISFNGAGMVVSQGGGVVYDRHGITEHGRRLIAQGRLSIRDRTLNEEQERIMREAEVEEGLREAASRRRQARASVRRVRERVATHHHHHHQVAAVGADREEAVRAVAGDGLEYEPGSLDLDDGLAPEQIDRMPSNTFQNHSDSSSECPICLMPFERDEATQFLACAHRFHAVCIRPWLRKSRACPVCRIRVHPIA